jgi:hypothetical protein
MTAKPRSKWVKPALRRLVAGDARQFVGFGLDGMDDDS